MDEKRISLINFCGEEVATGFLYRCELEKQIKTLQVERISLEEELKKSFSVDLSIIDVLVASIAGIMAGAMNGIFKTHIPKYGKLKHEHSTTRTPVDYKVPKPEGMKGSVQGLHRQIGPGHDLGRFKEALELMSGDRKDFPLWGTTIAERTGGSLHAGNVRLDVFKGLGGFKIPENPAAELMNHLLIDFFTKTSLPLPFTSYIADNSETMAKIMLGMYDNGLNLKTLVGNLSNIAILQLITHSYAYIFKSAKTIDFYKKLPQINDAKEFLKLFKELNEENKNYIKSKEFNILQAIAHGSSFLVDSVITMGSKNYAGLFCLDYGTLLIFSTDVIKYLKQSFDIHKKASSNIKTLNEYIMEQECLWYNHFNEDMIRLASKDNFFETFNPELIMAKHNEIFSKLESGETHRNNMLKELREWDV